MKALAAIIGLAVLCRGYVINAIFPVTIFRQEHILFFDLINYSFSIPFWMIVFFGLINILFIFFIGNVLFDYRIAILSALLYAISPWTIYLEVAGSLDIVLLTILLLATVGVLKMKQGTSYRTGMAIFIFTSSLLLYSSIVFWFLIPLMTLGIIKLLFLKVNQIKTITALVVMIFIPLSLLAVKNTQGFSGVFTKEIAIFSEVGLLNAVNQFQGDLAREGIYTFGRIIENRYTYFTQHLIFNFLKHFTPVTYFTAEYKLLNFSFSPPILLGFIIPFIFGLKGWVDIFKKYRYLIFLPPLLILPSALSYKSPDFSKLIIFAPVIFYTISFGMVNYLFFSKSKVLNFLKIACLLLVAIQSLSLISDIKYREPARIDFLRFPSFYQRN